MITDEKRELARKLVNRHGAETLALMFINADNSLTQVREAHVATIRRESALERLLAQRARRIEDLERRLVEAEERLTVQGNNVAYAHTLLAKADKENAKLRAAGDLLDTAKGAGRAVAGINWLRVRGDVPDDQTD